MGASKGQDNSRRPPGGQGPEPKQDTWLEQPPCTGPSGWSAAPRSQSSPSDQLPPAASASGSPALRHQLPSLALHPQIGTGFSQSFVSFVTSGNRSREAKATLTDPEDLPLAPFWLPLKTWVCRRISAGLNGTISPPSRKDNVCKAPRMLPGKKRSGRKLGLLILSRIKSLITKPSTRRGGGGAKQEGNPDHFSWASKQDQAPVPSSCPLPLHLRPADP